MFKQNPLAQQIGYSISMQQPSQSRTIHFDNAGINIDRSEKAIKAVRVLTYDVFSGDVYLCTFQGAESTVTGPMEGAAKFHMHQAMLAEHRKLNADQLSAHASRGNPYAIHEQSVRANDGDLLKAEPPPHYEDIRFVLKGAAS
jgi:hypothetical protein